VDRPSTRDERGLAEGLGERRVRVDRRDHIVRRRLEAHRERRLGDQLTGLRPDDVNADDALILPGGDDLRDAIALAKRPRAAGRRNLEGCCSIH
jgi:hypothetical protein